jgi:hypothetical protein
MSEPLVTFMLIISAITLVLVGYALYNQKQHEKNLAQMFAEQKGTIESISIEILSALRTSIDKLEGSTAEMNNSMHDQIVSSTKSTNDDIMTIGRSVEEAVTTSSKEVTSLFNTSYNQLGEEIKSMKKSLDEATTL